MSGKVAGKEFPGQLNSIQLNVVAIVDVQKAIATQVLAGNLYMVDNSVNSQGLGTACLQTVCKQGQVINWIIYSMDMDRRPNGSWPPMARINNIVFLGPDGEETADLKVCTEFKIYGAPDKNYSKQTPVYYYWAGTVLPNLPLGVHKYRLIIELDRPAPEQPLYLNLDTPSLSVVRL